jgi:TMEM199 family protein
MTNAIVKALENLGIQYGSVESEDGSRNQAQGQEPSLSGPTIGKPISHGQVIDISRQLKNSGYSSYHLDILLLGSRVYVPPPQPKPEPVSQTQKGLVHMPLAAC